jgi:hypothetical protein
MLPSFPPQFFILLGIDIFLGTSIATVAFDEHFPTGLPYMLDFGALVGFIQLVLGPRYLVGSPTEIQFYYCMTFATIAILAALGCNLYVTFIRGRRAIGGILAVGMTTPSILVSLSFVSAYVNNVYVSLPMMPLLPWMVVWSAFFGASGLVALATVMITYHKRIRQGI